MFGGRERERFAEATSPLEGKMRGHEGLWCKTSRYNEHYSNVTDYFECQYSTNRFSSLIGG